MSLKWSIGLMTGTVNDGFIDIAALRTDGKNVVEFGTYDLAAYKDRDWSTAQIIWAEFWHKKMYYWALLKVLTTNKPHFD